MVFRFLILSEETENFKREIKIDADNTFFDFFEAIVSTTNLDKKKNSSFFLCSDDWRKKQEISLFEREVDFDEDVYLMDECVLSDYLEDEKQKLVFVFDYENQRALYIILSELIPGKYLKQPSCTFSSGDIELNIAATEEESVVKPVKTIETIDVIEPDEKFFGDESYDMDEIDEKGFDELDDYDTDLSENNPFA